MPGFKAEASGSPAGEPVYLVVGFLRRPHGVHGEIIMDLHTDFPERLTTGKTFFVGESRRPMDLVQIRNHAKGMLVKFEGVESPEQAGVFRNQWLFIKTTEVPALPEGQLYQHQLLGLEVVDDHDRALGQLTEIIETGANDVYVVTDSDGREVLLPAIPEVILDVDPGRRLMRVHLLDGLIQE
jgi:16S rRNA processing protein RimM